MSSRAKAYLALIITAILWGSALPIVKSVFKFINPFQFLYLRYLLASILILPALTYCLKRFHPHFKDILKIVALEMIQVIALICLYLGLEKTSAIEASLLGSTDPIFITLGGIIFLKEHQQKKEWRGLIISFFGTIFLLLEPYLSNHNYQLKLSLIGNLLMFAYLVTIAAYYLLAKIHYRHYSKIMVTTISYPTFLFTFYCLNRIYGFSLNLNLLNQPTVLLTTVYMAVFGSIIAFTLYLIGQNLIEASEAAMFTYLHIPFSLLFAFILLQEIISWPQLIGIAIIAFGVYLAESRRKRYNR